MFYSPLGPGSPGSKGGKDGSWIGPVLSGGGATNEPGGPGPSGLDDPGVVDDDCFPGPLSGPPIPGLGGSFVPVSGIGPWLGVSGFRGTPELGASGTGISGLGGVSDPGGPGTGISGFGGTRPGFGGVISAAGGVISGFGGKGSGSPGEETGGPGPDGKD